MEGFNPITGVVIKMFVDRSFGSTHQSLFLIQYGPGAKIDLGIAGVGGFEGSVLRVPDVTLKTLKNTEPFPQIVAIDLKQISKMIGTEVAGVAGYDFFSEYKITIDYYGAEIRLSK